LLSSSDAVISVPLLFALSRARGHHPDCLRTSQEVERLLDRLVSLVGSRAAHESVEDYQVDEVVEQQLGGIDPERMLDEGGRARG
jgi:hypothetical protein